LAALAVVTTAAGLGLASPAYAAALSNVAWSVSVPHPGSTGVRYTWSFTTGAVNTISTITFTVPTGTTVPAANVPSVVDTYGITGGTAAFDGVNTVTYTVTTPASIPASTPILISMDGFTNTSTANSYTSVVNTTFDSGTSSAVGINDNTTVVNVVVARSTAFTSDTTSFGLTMDPSVAALKDQTKDVTLTVATNATNGYTLNTKVSQIQTGIWHNTNTLAAASAGMASGVASGSFATNTFGYKMVKSGGVGTLQSASLLSGDYIGYTTVGENTFAATAPTNLDTVVITNRAKIDYTQRADTYRATVTYTVTPSY
jgi:hypothetical protein